MPSLIRYFARQLIPGLASIYDSPTKIVDELKGMGWSYTNQTMFRDVNEVLDLGRWGSFFRGVSGTLTVPDEFYGRSYTMRAGRKYMVSGRATLKDRVSGELSERPISYYSDRKLSGADEIDAVDKYLKGLERYGPDFDVVEFSREWGKINMNLESEVELRDNRRRFLSVSGGAEAGA